MNGTWYWYTQNSHYDIGDIVVLKDPHGDRTLIRRWSLNPETASELQRRHCRQ